MSTLNKIFNKITDKTELAKHKVDLANLKDLASRLKDIYTYQKKLDVINPKVIELLKQQADTKSNFKSLIRNTEDTLIEFDKSAQLLGLDPSNVAEYKTLKNEIGIVKQHYIN